MSAEELLLCDRVASNFIYSLKKSCAALDNVYLYSHKSMKQINRRKLMFSAKTATVCVTAEEK